MRAIVLAGGIGSRLRPFTWVVPKPLVPVGEMPIIEIVLRQLEQAGFDRVTLSVGYLSSLIEAFCGTGSRWGLGIDYLREQEPLGTAGCLSLVKDLNEDRLLVVNGDILTDLDLREAYSAHEDRNAATIYSQIRTVQSDFGVLHVDSDGCLARYEEKPTITHDVSMGVNVLSSWAIERFISRHEKLDMPDLMRRFVDSGQRVRVIPTKAYWLDMGRMADLEIATEVFLAERGRFLK